MGKTYKTQLSSGASTERNNLKRPHRIRTREKPHKCQHCSYACRYKNHLKIHERVHTGEKPFNCRHCPFKTAQKSSLNRHERCHTGDGPFKCQHCSFGATQRSNLIAHERTHFREEPFKCQHCNYSSTIISHLKTHQKSHIRGDMRKLEHTAKLRSSLTTQKRLQSRRKSLKCKISPQRTTVPIEKYAKITDIDSSRKQNNRVPATHLQDLLQDEEESFCQDTQLDSWDEHKINESSCQRGFEIFICKECNYALFSEKELCMHYSFCHKLPVVNLNIERTDWSIQQ